MRTAAIQSPHSASSPTLPAFTQVPALSSLLSLTCAELLADFPSLLTSLYTGNLLHPPSPSTLPSSTSSRLSPVSLHQRVEAKTLAWIQQGPNASATREREQWLGLNLLLALIHSADLALLRQSHSQWTKALKSLHLRSTHLPLHLRVLSLECQVALLHRVASTSPDLRGPLVKETLTSTVSDLTQLVQGEAGAASSTHLRRLLVAVKALIGDYTGSIKLEEKATLRSLLIRLLLHRDDGLVPLVTSSLTRLHVSLSSTSALQRPRVLHQQIIEREAHNTVEEEEERKWQLPSDPTSSLSPYLHLCLQALHSMRDGLNSVRVSLSLPSLSSTSMRFDDFPALAPSLLPFESLLRHQRLTALILALMSPSSTSTTQWEVPFPVSLLLHTVFATLSMDAASAKESSPSVLILPAVYRAALTLLHEVVSGAGWELLVNAEMVAGLLMDLHRRWGENLGLHELLPLLYEVTAAFLSLPLSPTVIESVSRLLLPPLLEQVKQPLMARQGLHQLSSAQRMSAQLRGGDQKKSASPVAGVESLSSHPPLWDLIATSALSVLCQLIQCLAFVSPSIRQPLRRRIDGTLLTLALTVSGSTDAAPAGVRCGVYRCLLQAVMGGGEAGVTGVPSALLVYALRIFDEAAKEGETAEVRGLCQRAVLACDALRAEKEGLVTGQRRSRVHLVADSVEVRDRELEQSGLQLLNDFEIFNASAPHSTPPLPTAPSPPAAQPNAPSLPAWRHPLDWTPSHEANGQQHLKVGEKRKRPLDAAQDGEAHEMAAGDATNHETVAGAWESGEGEGDGESEEVKEEERGNEGEEVETSLQVERSRAEMEGLESELRQEARNEDEDGDGDEEVPLNVDDEPDSVVE